MKTQKEYNQCQQPISCHNCSSNQMCQAWVDFVKHHNDTKPYAHFDLRVSLSMPSIRKYVMDRLHTVFIHLSTLRRKTLVMERKGLKSHESYTIAHI